MAGSQLPLRDVHLPPAPAWWPPAPGWWLLAAAVLLVLAVAWVLLLRRRRRRAGWARVFDAETAVAADDVQWLAIASALLRRAARRVQPDADRLRDEAWLRLLDGRRGTAFSAGPGRVLLDGGYRAELQLDDPARVKALVRVRFLELMAGRR